MEAEDKGYRLTSSSLLGLIALGFLGYALWRSVQAIADPDKEGTGVKALGKRVGYGVRTLVYAGLAFSAVGLILGSGSEGGGSPDDWTALLLSWPEVEYWSSVLESPWSA